LGSDNGWWRLGASLSVALVSLLASAGDLLDTLVEE